MPSENTIKTLLGEDHLLIIKDYFRDLCVTAAVAIGMSAIGALVDLVLGNSHETEKIWTHEIHRSVYICVMIMLAAMTAFRIFCIMYKSFKKSWAYTNARGKS